MSQSTSTLSNFSPEERDLAARLLRPHTAQGTSFDSEQFLSYLGGLNSQMAAGEPVTTQALMRAGMVRRSSAEALGLEQPELRVAV